MDPYHVYVFRTEIPGLANHIDDVQCYGCLILDRIGIHENDSATMVYNRLLHAEQSGLIGFLFDPTHECVEYDNAPKVIQEEYDPRHFSVSQPAITKVYYKLSELLEKVEYDLLSSFNLLFSSESKTHTKHFLATTCLTGSTFKLCVITIKLTLKPHWTHLYECVEKTSVESVSATFKLVENHLVNT